jgi:hypothetical protein
MCYVDKNHEWTDVPAALIHVLALAVVFILCLACAIVLGG